jgi:tetratricopeptide (TPR) repeat protein
MTQTVANAIIEKGGRLEPRELGEAVRQHIEQSTLVFQGHLKSVLVPHPTSPVSKATPPSRVSQFEFVDRWDVNAWAILAEERPLILFHAGIPFSLFELFNSLLARNEILKDLFGATEPNSPAFSRPKLDYSYLKSGSWPASIPLTPKQVEALTRNGNEVHPDARYMVNWSHYVQSRPHASNRQKFAHEAYTTALHFLFCHELGHIDRGHLELRNRHTNSFALHEVSYAQSPSPTMVSFDANVLQALESDADTYALAHAMRIYYPKATLGGYEPSLGDRKPGDPQCHRLFLFSIGVLFLFMEYQRTSKKRGVSFLKSLFGNATTHPSSFVRIQALVLYADMMLHQAGLELAVISAASKQTLEDLVEVAKLLGLDPKLLIVPQVSTLISLRARLKEMGTELEECSAVTRERYYREGKQVTYAEGRRNAEDLYHLRGQTVVLNVDGKEINIPFLEEDASVAEFLENSGKWEEGGYVDNAVLYALLATSRDPQSEAARARLTAIQTRLGRHAAAFDELLRKHGHRSHLADRLSETLSPSDIQTDPGRALQVLEALAVLRPRDATGRLRLADCKMLLRDFTGAAHEYGQALVQSGLQQERIHALVGMGNCGAECGLTNDAVEWFQQALAIDGRNVHALRNLGIALVRGRRPEEGVPYLERALEAAPSDASLWFECSAAYYACQKFDKAREHLGKAIALAPDAERYREGLAQLDRLSRS